VSVLHSDVGLLAQALRQGKGLGGRDCALALHLMPLFTEVREVHLRLRIA
jgi:hypothetical protein